MSEEQLQFLNTDKKCRNCRKKKDIKPKGAYKCAGCGYYFYTE